MLTHISDYTYLADVQGHMHVSIHGVIVDVLIIVSYGTQVLEVSLGPLLQLLREGK